MLQRVSSPEFIGRGPELTALLEALDRAADQRFSAVFVAGESGVGKSRLLRELEREAQERGALVLAGECVTLTEGELPYAPLRSALRHLARELGVEDDELARLLTELGGGAGAPAANEEPARDPRAQARMFDLLLDVLTRFAEDAPVVVVIEDVHWADRSTLDLLAFLITSARREALLLVCSYRTDELHRRHPLRAFLAAHERPPAVQRVDLHRFTQDELEAQLHGILDAAPERALVTRLHERTEGNAFFTEELLAASRDGTALPASLREALMLRVDVLSPPAQRLVRLVAVHGQPTSHRLLAAAGRLSDDELQGALREAVANQVLVRRDEDTYALRHALFVEALEADLLPGERTDLHLALAAAIEREPTLVDANARAAAELGAHWLAAGRLPEALTAAVRAGAEAEQVHAFAEAGDHFRRALELWHRVDEPEQLAGMDEGALYARAAEAADLSSDGANAIRLVRAAIDRVDPASDPYRAAMLRAQLGRYLFLLSGDVEAAEHAHREAVDLLPADQPRRELARVLATLGRILMVRGRTDESLRRSAEALAVARAAGARAEEAHALNTLGANLGHLGDRRSSIAYTRESLAISAELGDADGVACDYLNLSETIDQDGRLEESVQVALEGARHAAESGLRDRGHLLEGDAAHRLFTLGRLDEADRLTRHALDLRPSLSKYAQCAARARIEIARGHIAAAEALLNAAREATSSAPGPTWIEPFASARVELELLRGRPDEALREVLRALVQSGDHEYVAFTARLHALGARATAEAAERARASGDEAAAAQAADRARRLLERIEGLIDRNEGWRGTPPPKALAYRDLCALEAARAVGDASGPAWAAMATSLRKRELRLEEAYARLREAESHLLDGERALAGQAVAAGLDITRPAGAAWLQNDLLALARRGRLHVPDDASAGNGAVAQVEVDAQLGLTERERAVLELVALGMTNREIGEQLFMATKTASVHVSRILTKLGVSSRVEAATAAQRLGLVP